MRRHILWIILLTFVLKFSYFLFSLAVAKFNPANDTAFTTGEFLTLFKKNDSFWYQKAAETGYPRITDDRELGYSEGTDYRQSVWAHFPLYPLLIRYTERLFNCDFEHSCFILSCVFSLSCFIGFYFLCIRLFAASEKDSFFYTMVFMLFPFHYYFNMYYTEALFFTCVAFSFLAISKKNYLAAAFWFIPLTLVRPNGIVTLLPLFFYFIETEGGFKYVMSCYLNLNKTLLLRSLCFLTAPLAMAIYCLYQKEMTGHYFAFVQAQYGWYKEFMFPFLALFRRGDLPTQFNSVYVIVVMVFCIFTWRKLPLSLNLLLWISILLPMASGSVACMPRYISVLFPITICLGSLLPKKNFRVVALGLLFCLQLLTFYPWLFMDPFSY